MNGVNTILGYEKFISDIKNSVRETNETLTLLHKMLSENRGGVKQLVSSGNELIEEGNNLLAETKEPLVTSLQKLNTLLDSSDSLLIRLNAFSDEVKSKGNNFGKLLYDDEMMNELKDSIIKINQLTKILIEQLENDGVNVDANIDLF
jgi:ABC-type transporter Mla subunit MlaD